MLKGRLAKWGSGGGARYAALCVLALGVRAIDAPALVAGPTAAPGSSSSDQASDGPTVEEGFASTGGTGAAMVSGPPAQPAGPAAQPMVGAMPVGASALMVR